MVMLYGLQLEQELRSMAVMRRMVLRLGWVLWVCILRLLIRMCLLVRLCVDNNIHK
jgi:hypothetical protein